MFAMEKHIFDRCNVFKLMAQVKDKNCGFYYYYFYKFLKTKHNKEWKKLAKKHGYFENGKVNLPWIQWLTSDSLCLLLSRGETIGIVFDRNGLKVVLASLILTCEYVEAVDELRVASSSSSSSLTPGSLITAVTRVWQPPQLTDSTLKFSNRATLAGRNWLEKHSSPWPSFPCLPSPNVYSLPLSER